MIESGVILSIIITNGLFLSLRALFQQKNTLQMGAISNTHTEETDYIVAYQFLIGYMNNLTVPLLLGLILEIMVIMDSNTNITGSETGVISSLRTNFSWMQWIEFFSAYFFVFVSYFKGPKWCQRDYLTVMPIVFFIVFILGDCIFIPLTEWTLLWLYRDAIDQTGYAHFFHLCGLLQLAFVLLVLRQLTDTIYLMYDNVVKQKRLLAASNVAVLDPLIQRGDNNREGN